MGLYRLQLIGAFALSKPDGEVIHISSEKSRALLALVALARSGVRSRGKLREILWDSEHYPESNANLRRELSNLRSRLARAGAQELLIIDTANVMLALDRISVDVLELESGQLRWTSSDEELLEGIDVAGSEEFEDWLRLRRQSITDQLDTMPARLHPADIASENAPKPDGFALADDEASDDREESLPPKPSLAVLPFDVPASDLPHWWGISLHEGLTAKLSGFPQLLVGSSRSAARASAEMSDLREIARRIGVAYVVDGSILPDAAGCRIVVKLLNGATGEQIWTRIFSTELGEDNALDDRTISSISHGLWTAIDASERAKFIRMRRAPQTNYERYWIANSLYRSWQGADIARASIIARELAKNDPACPWSNSLAAFCTALAWLFQSLPDPKSLRSEALEHVKLARAYGPDNAETLGYCAGTLTLLDANLDIADRIIAHSLEILPDHQPTLFWGGWIDLARDDPDRARHRFQRSLQVNPDSTARPLALCGTGAANLVLGDFDAALKSFDEAIVADPTSPIGAAGKALTQTAIHAGEMSIPKPETWGQAITMLSSALSKP